MLLKIAVKPIVLKFLSVYLGKAYKLRTDDLYGACLDVQLQKKASRKPTGKGMARYSTTFYVETNQHCLQKKGYQGLSERSTVIFNNTVELALKMEFHCLAYTYTTHGKQTIQKAVDDFMAKFGLTPEDIDPMSLRRSYLRYRNHLERQEREARELLIRHGIDPDQMKVF